MRTAVLLRKLSHAQNEFRQLRRLEQNMKISLWPDLGADLLAEEDHLFNYKHLLKYKRYKNEWYLQFLA